MNEPEERKEIIIAFLYLHIYIYIYITENVLNENGLPDPAKQYRVARKLGKIHPNP
jgi:hypothetical protein